MLYFQKAYHAWHISKRDESIQTWKKLGEIPHIPRKYKEIIEHNNISFGNTINPIQNIEFTIETKDASKHTKYYINN